MLSREEIDFLLEEIETSRDCTLECLDPKSKKILGKRIEERFQKASEILRREKEDVDEVFIANDKVEGGMVKAFKSYEAYEEFLSKQSNPDFWFLNTVVIDKTN